MMEGKIKVYKKKTENKKKWRQKIKKQQFKTIEELNKLANLYSNNLSLEEMKQLEKIGWFILDLSLQVVDW